MDEPTITIPLSFFKELALGYRYTSYCGKEADNLRDKCVLRKELIDILQKVEGVDKYFHIQPTSADDSSLPLVWDIREWKESGEKREVLQKECDIFKDRADRLTRLLKKKLPHVEINMLRHLCLQYVQRDVDLSMYGIKKEEYMI